MIKSGFSYQPIKYYSLILVFTWLFLFLGAYLSHHDHLHAYQIPFLFLGLISPLLVTLWMMLSSRDPRIITDFYSRIFNISFIPIKYWIVIFLIMPITVVLATFLSFKFGLPRNQFEMSDDFRGINLLFTVIALIMAPTVEELSWRGYGMDSLLSKKYSLLSSTLVFAFLWALWHFPLFFVNGYYHYEIYKLNPLFGFNFIVALFPTAVIINWIYYRSNRNIFIIILFHSLINFFSMLWQTEQFTKCIVTLLLSLIAIGVVFKNKLLFASKRLGN